MGSSSSADSKDNSTDETSARGDVEEKKETSDENSKGFVNRLSSFGNRQFPTEGSILKLMRVCMINL